MGKKFFTLKNYGDEDDYSFKSKSSTSWETSYFGGYWRVIASLPRLESEKITIEKPIEVSAMSLFSTEIRKLALNLIDLSCKAKMLFPYTEEFYVALIKGKPTTMRKRTLERQGIVDAIAKLEKHELGNLFLYYKELLLGLIIAIDEPAPPDECPAGMPQNAPGEGEGEEGEDEGNAGKGEGENGEDDEGEGKSKRGKPGMIDLSKEITEPAKSWGTLDSSGMTPVFKIFRNNQFKTDYSRDQEFYASQLRDQLDIDFNPKSDRINSLRHGKLETNKISELVAGNPYAYHMDYEDAAYEPFSVCILGDESGSMMSFESYTMDAGGYPTHHARHDHMMLTYQTGIIKTLYKCFSTIMKPGDLYIYGHSGQSSPHISVYLDPLSPNFEQNINVLEKKLRDKDSGKNQGIPYMKYNSAVALEGTNHIGQENYDGYAIEAIYERLRTFTPGNILFIYLSDGMPNSTTEMSGMEKIKRYPKNYVEIK